MGTSLVQESDLKPRRRRSHKKSSKELYELRRRWKSIIFWLVLSLIGVAAKKRGAATDQQPELFESSDQGTVGS